MGFTGIRRLSSRLWRAVRALRARCRCPLCGSDVDAFLPNKAGRPDVRCPRCGSSDRARFVRLFLERSGALQGGGALLHFAPEAALAPWLAGLPGVAYTSVDLAPGRAMEVGDITALRHRAGSFKAVICSHVLEHVPDDRAAMREIRRVLRPDGVAVVLVPLRGERTDEDPAVTSEDARRRRFGRHDHVRLYGRDIEDRLRECGLEPVMHRATEVLSAAERRRFGITNDELLLACTPAPAGAS